MAGLLPWRWSSGLRYAPRGGRQSAVPAKWPRCRLVIEGLESRWLPSTVTNLNDVGPGSLRQAVFDTPDGGTVDFAPDLRGTVALTSGPIQIFQGLTIAGPGADQITVSGGNAFNVFSLVTGSNYTISGLTIANGRGGFGGGIYDPSGNLTVTDCTVRDNHAGVGGGLYASRGTVSVVNSVIRDNVADDRGGGLYTNFNTRVAVTGSAVTGNASTFFGGGIYAEETPLSVTGSAVTGNASLYGGGVYSYFSTTSLTDSTVSDNTGNQQGGGVLAVHGSLAVTASTLAGNTGMFYGGAVYLDTVNQATVSGSTFAGNASGVGAAVYVYDSTLSVSSATLSGNTANSVGGIALNTPFSTVNVRNTLVAGNAAPFNPDVGGRFTSQGHNLIGIGDGGSGFAATDLVGTMPNPIDPLLGPLQDNGGPTQTMLPSPGSPAVDAGDNADTSAYDQRGPGYGRVVGGIVDIGSVEAQIGPAVAFAVAAPDTVLPGTPFDVTVTALDAYGHVASGYTGTVTFSTTDADPGVVLPADYAFTADDQGVHTFTDTGRGETTLVTPGEQTITVSDTDGGTVFGSVAVTVDGSGAPGGHSPRGGASAASRGGKEHAADWAFAALYEETSGLAWRRTRHGL